MEYTRAHLSAKRFGHVERVAQTLDAIAESNRLDRHACRVAGWLHDCAKEAARATVLNLIVEGTLEMDEETRESPNLWHGYHAAWIGETEFGIKDEAVLEAVKYHPTGTADWSEVGLALFVADYAEPGRPMDWTQEIRDQAQSNLIGAAIRVCKEKIRYLKDRGKQPHSRSEAFLEWMKTRSNGQLSGVQR